MIMPSCDAGDALGLARRIAERLAETELDAGRAAHASPIGIAQGPEHAMNPRELVACAEIAMMTAKARGKNQIVVFEDEAGERPAARRGGPRRPLDRTPEDAAERRRASSTASTTCARSARRSSASCGRSSTTTTAASTSWRATTSCPSRVRGDARRPRRSSGRGARVPSRRGHHRPRRGDRPSRARRQRARLRLRASTIPGHRGRGRVDRSPCRSATAPASSGVIVISKLGIGQFDEDDVRLLEVLAGHASVALENARLYEAERREAERARESRRDRERAARLQSRAGAAESAGRRARSAPSTSAARVLGCPERRVWLQQARRRAAGRPRGVAAPLAASGSTWRASVDRRARPRDRRRRARS